MKDFEGALKILKEFLPEVDPFNKIYYTDLIAIINQELKNNTEAKDYYQKAIQLIRKYVITSYSIHYTKLYDASW